jgi:hypothetical protein
MSKYSTGFIINADVSMSPLRYFTEFTPEGTPYNDISINRTMVCTVSEQIVNHHIKNTYYFKITYQNQTKIFPLLLYTYNKNINVALFDLLDYQEDIIPIDWSQSHTDPNVKIVGYDNPNDYNISEVQCQITFPHCEQFIVSGIEYMYHTEKISSTMNGACALNSNNQIVGIQTSTIPQKIISSKTIFPIIQHMIQNPIYITSNFNFIRRIIGIKAIHTSLPQDLSGIMVNEITHTNYLNHGDIITHIYEDSINEFVPVNCQNIIPILFRTPHGSALKLKVRKVTNYSQEIILEIKTYTYLDLSADSYIL